VVRNRQTAIRAASGRGGRSRAAGAGNSVSARFQAVGIGTAGYQWCPTEKA